MNGYSDPELLDARHIVAGFDCGNAMLSSWLTTRALRNQGRRCQPYLGRHRL